jgi:hypothetical protein
MPIFLLWLFLLIIPTISFSNEIVAADSTRQVLDTLPILAKSRADSVVLIQHHFNHREQIVTGGVVMACIAAMMAIMNNYNPH